MKRHNIFGGCVLLVDQHSVSVDVGVDSEMEVRREGLCLVCFVTTGMASMFVCQSFSAKTLRFTQCWVRMRMQCVLQPFPHSSTCCQCHTYKCSATHYSDSCAPSSEILIFVMSWLSPQLKVFFFFFLFFFSPSSSSSSSSNFLVSSNFSASNTQYQYRYNV